MCANAVTCAVPAPTPGAFMVRQTAVAHSSWVLSLLLVASSTSARRKRDLQPAEGGMVAGLGCQSALQERTHSLSACSVAMSFCRALTRSDKVSWDDLHAQRTTHLLGASKEYSIQVKCITRDGFLTCGPVPTKTSDWLVCRNPAAAGVPSPGCW